MRRRVVITGATGFLGGHALRSIVNMGFEPHLLVRDVVAGQAALSSAGASGEVHAVDVLDDAAVANAIHVLQPWGAAHFAWHDEPHSRWTSSENLKWTEATLALARSLSAAGAQRLVVCGSCAEYDWSGEELSELETSLSPSTLYGASKAAAFLALDSAQAQLNLSIAWGRVFYSYGPGEPPGRLISDLISKLSRGQPAEFTDGLQVRDYMHAADIGDAFGQLLASDLVGPLNVASGQGVEVRRLIETTARLMGKRELVRLGALPRRPGDPARLVGNAQRLHTELGFRPRFSLESGLADTLGASKQPSRQH